jgi:hypothetical protein
MIKMLSVQVSIAKQDSEASGCDCMNGEVATPLPGRSPNFTQEDAPFDPLYERYVWATGGHSAAAAHGNLFNESYTAHIERNLQPLFASLGIDFEARNYAMGGTRWVLIVDVCVLVVSQDKLKICHFPLCWFIVLVSKYQVAGNKSLETMLISSAGTLA